MVKAKRKCAGFLALALVAVLAAPVTSRYAEAGDWLGDWVSGQTGSGATYYQGQQRGYASAGSFSARWPSTVGAGNIVTFQPPKLRAGCGGIDFFAGSIAFLNPDLLVEKLQRILQNAAGVAFDMALQTLCPKCSEIMKSMENLANQLNALASDDCKLATSLVNKLRPEIEGAASTVREGIESAAVTTGLSEINAYATKGIDAMGGALKDANTWLNTQRGDAADTESLKKSCNSAIAKFFPSKTGDYPVSMLKQTLTDAGMPDSYANMIRGLVGDVAVWSATDKPSSIARVSSCPQNEGLSAEELMDGKIWHRPTPSKASPDPACILVNDVSLKKYAADRMGILRTAMKTKDAGLLTTDVNDFARRSPMALFYAMRVGISTYQDDVFIENLSGIFGITYLEKSIRDLADKQAVTRETIMQLINKAADQGVECNLSAELNLLEKAEVKFTERSKYVRQLLAKSMESEMSNYTKVIQVAQNFEQINGQLERMIATKYGPSVTQRLMAKLR